jgi:hypothetical protein
MVDYVKPDGTEVMRTIADYRQLNDALFHAGLDSGSEFEFIDEPNELHFYIADIDRNSDGILSYTVAVRSLRGDGPHIRGVELNAPASGKVNRSGYIEFEIANTGSESPVAEGIHPSDPGSGTSWDIFRLEAETDNPACSVKLLNELATVRNGDTIVVPVYIIADSDVTGDINITLRAVSESDRSVSATALQRVKL